MDYDDEFIQMVPPTEGPIIVPLVEDKLRTRRGVTFDILSSDFSADCKAQFDWITGRRKTRARIPKRSEAYRQRRQEFLCFMSCYAFMGIFALLSVVLFLVSILTDSDKWEWGDRYSYRETSDMSAYKAKNLRQRLKYFLFSDMGADDDEVRF